MHFDEGIALYISTIIGAGIFAIPVLSYGLSPLYIFLAISLGFFFSIFLGYTILDLAPADVEEEVSRVLGTAWSRTLHVINIAIILLSLVAYAIGLEYHLKTNFFIIFLLLLIPLLLDIKFPAPFSIFLSIFLLIFLAFVSLINMSSFSIVELSFSRKIVAPLLFATYFAFFGHNIIPRIRNIVRNLSEVKEILLLVPFMVFLVYLPFTLTTSYLGYGEIATQVLARIYPEPLSSIFSLSAAIIFYTSFILLGLHLKDMFPHRYSSAIIVILVTLLYYFSSFFRVSFSALIASAGFFVTIWALIVSFAAYKSAKKKPFIQQLAPAVTALLALIPYLFILI